MPNPTASHCDQRRDCSGHVTRVHRNFTKRTVSKQNSDARAYKERNPKYRWPFHEATAQSHFFTIRDVPIERLTRSVDTGDRIAISSEFEAEFKLAG